MILPLKIIHPSALLSGGRSNFERTEMKNKAIMVEYEGKQRSITSLAREYGITSGCLYYRLTHGWSVERAVNEPMENGRANTYQYKGKWYNAAELAKLNGEVSPCTMHQRLLSGMSVAEAVETPNRRKHLRKRITEEEQKRIFKPIEHKPDTTLCRSCIYHGSLNGTGGAGASIYCDYIEIMLERRPCPPGPDCTAHVKGKSIVRKMALKRMGKVNG